MTINPKMNDSWHIPRVSLATSADSSSNNSHKSNSNPPTFSKRSQNLKQINDTKLNIGMLAPDIRGFSSNHSGSSTHSHYHNTNYDNKNTIDDVHVDHRGQRDIRATYNSDNSNLNNPSKRSASTKKHKSSITVAKSADSSSNNSHKSNSNPPTFSKRSQNLKQINDTKLNIGMLAPDIRGFSSNHSGSSTHSHYHNTNYDNKNTIDDVHVDHRGQRDIRATYNSDNSNLNNPSKRSASTKKHKSSITVAKSASKRGSRTSLGSTDSNNSTKSASSGSLLLTAANLERFAEIHKIQNKMYLENIADAESLHQTSSHYNNNLTHMVECNNKVVVDDAIGRDFVITLDENLDFSKAKDGDTVSMASSMHFTMVNGEGGQSKKTKPGLCDRGRQVSVLIISMSLVFLLLILGMVYVLEMRAREMLQS